MLRGITLVKWSRSGGQAHLIKISALWAGVVWAVMTTVFICAALALWVLMTNGMVYHFSSIITASILLGAIIGGIVSGNNAGGLGLLHGTVVGLLYFVAIFSFLIAWNGGMPPLSTAIVHLLMVLIPAALGGVIGINLPIRGKNRSHTRLNYTAHR
ncbi:putative membrane protein, TIGR04086 family [Desulfotomaculum arcticum]|uniref:Putative membrane protein, TIGR04086 family n=1 Tax=Desulfotruncus arcticus DSM 17038 TaxID=1121424 RepID=A0A1I2UGL4_9FIRM|nr:TIGR04086 family membrane protein [Desulfotruncus arcticus]SFG76275.1 putative membrane protein, TIGR04086 family [Desulfotomaculum arcticum] [Desulfotruncus arcticus DSM 17038]